MLYLIISFSTNSSLVGPCSLASLSHAQPPCFDRSSIFPGLRRRSYAKQAKLRHYPLANQRFLRSVFILISTVFTDSSDVYSTSARRVYFTYDVKVCHILYYIFNFSAAVTPCTGIISYAFKRNCFTLNMDDFIADIWTNCMQRTVKRGNTGT